MRHKWVEGYTDGDPRDPSRIVQQHCSACGAVRLKRARSKKYGRAWKYKKGSKFTQKVYLPNCDGRHGIFI